MRTRFVLVALTIVAVLAGGSRPAGADGQNGGGHAGGSTTPGGARVEVVVPGSGNGGFSSDGYSGDGGATSSIECRYFAVTSGSGRDVLPGVGALISDAADLDAGTPIWVTCRDTTTGAITYSNIVRWDPTNPPVVTPSAEVLAQMAANGMTLPAPDVETWPTTGSTGLVNLPVWLHVDNWATLSTSASAGGLTATVEATPVRAVWNMGEGQVTCTDAGSTYDPALRPDPASSSCSYTYSSSSGGRPGQVFANSVVLVWHLAWSATNGQGGDLGELSSPAQVFTMHIEESQALVAPGGR